VTIREPHFALPMRIIDKGFAQRGVVTMAILRACGGILAAFLVLLLAIGVSGDVGQRPQSPLAITHVTVIDVSGAPAKPDMTVVIANGRIETVGKTGEVRLAEEARVLDATGKFLIPGLWDMHGHLTYTSENPLALLLEHGVTGVRDMGGDLERIDRWRKEIASGARLGPHIVRAGPFVDGPKPGAKDRLAVNNAAEARRAVATLKRRGVDFIKVHTGLSRESFFAVADEARKQGLPLAAHVPSGLWTKAEGVSIAEASDAGAKSLEHIEILLECALHAKDATAKSLDRALDELNGEAGKALFARLARNGTYYVPTLVAYYRGFVLWSGNPKETDGSRHLHRQFLELVKAMRRARVPIMAGSDFSDWALVPGIDLHNELALLVEAGLTPMEALQTATVQPARFLGKLDSQGTIETGKLADLVLLDANPLEDICHTRMINAVILGGRLIAVSEQRAGLLDPALAR
jgi:imidazolonepropionase-like amidohydrolase